MTSPQKSKIFIKMLKTKVSYNYTIYKFSFKNNVFRGQGIIQRQNTLPSMHQVPGLLSTTKVKKKKKKTTVIHKMGAN
jgi:hypothetical protein